MSYNIVYCYCLPLHHLASCRVYCLDSPIFVIMNINNIVVDVLIINVKWSDIVELLLIQWAGDVADQ